MNRGAKAVLVFAFIEIALTCALVDVPWRFLPASAGGAIAAAFYLLSVR